MRCPLTTAPIPSVHDLVLLGAGGQADEIEFFCEGKSVVRAVNHEYVKSPDLICLDHDAKHLAQNRSVIAVGAPYLKKMIADKWQGLNWTSAYAKDSLISSRANLNYGCVVAPKVVVMPGVSVGKHVLLNTSTVISHGTKIGDFATISPGTLIGGNCRIGEGVFIGIGAVVKDGVTIGNGATVGAGAVVIKDVEPLDVVVGNPARKIRTSKTWFADF